MLLTGSGKAVCGGWRGGGRPITLHVCATLVIFVSTFATRSDAKKNWRNAVRKTHVTTLTLE